MERTLIKENAVKECMESLRQSWTWEKLTEEERSKFEELAKGFRVNGTYDARWDQIQMLYHAFICGCGYDGFGWRPKQSAQDFWREVLAQ